MFDWISGYRLCFYALTHYSLALRFSTVLTLISWLLNPRLSTFLLPYPIKPVYLYIVHLGVAGAAVATPPTQPARSKNRVGELISSPELISDSCLQRLARTSSQGRNVLSSSAVTTE